ncbi:MAG: DNA alkylation repair protein [Polyangiaceae bacterium]|nr:DNA alkylation repair protein [Myxococcales bacterium]MCB9586163.1 DNA alkylation repair protein [Polyangiaceae bacterium]MCB9606840.1 DNA alkylation repair protein [Polyangiaceae bacterium]
MTTNALKTFFSPQLVRRLAKELVRAHPSFPERAFIKQASDKLEDLELLDRAKHIAAALKRQLPAAYPEALDVVLRALGPEIEGDELIGVGMGPFIYLPYALFIAEHGLEHFDLSMQAQRELTKRFTAESSIRAYIAKDPERACKFFEKWARDANPHVRRLVSEGTRLRLPWASRVKWLDNNPGRVVELLNLLKDDPTTLVRRSVANNLNDLGKLHPELLTRTCAGWLEDGSTTRRQLVEHALRSAVKRGEPGALALLGFGERPAVSVERVRFNPKRVAVGGRVNVSFALRSTSRKSQELLLDLVVHFVKANGATRPKVFKLKRLTLPSGGSATIESRVSFASMTTRKHYAGSHPFEVVVNGVAHPLGTLEVSE